MFRERLAFGLFFAVVVAAAALASVTEAPGDEPALWSGLGDRSYRITTSQPLAQRYFDQGLKLSYAFNHAEAIRAFRKAQAVDPECAMCFWGEALAYGPNINAPMDPSANRAALAAVAQARALAPRASLREQALITAVAKRYAAENPADRRTLETAYADAMAQAARRFPADSDIAVLYADALMNLSPWDYWEAGGKTPKGRAAEAIRTLERVLKKDPNHPQAIHLYIHAVEASQAPGRAERHADRLGRLMPAAGHVVHMPSHIYYRIGRYRDSIKANQAAIAADEAYLARSKARGIYPSGYYAHNIHFIVVSAQMLGARDIALEAARKLDGVIDDDVARAVPWVQIIKAAPYFAHVQLSDVATMLAVAEPDGALPYVKAMWHYMRAVALSARRDLRGAHAESAAIEAIAKAADFGGMIDGGVPAPDLLRLAQHVIVARIAQADGKLDDAAQALTQAIAIEDALPYLEPPYWYYPVRQTLGAVLLQAGNAAEAERVFQESLRRVPGNPWALWGLARAQAARDQVKAAAETEARFKKAWMGPADLPDLSRL